MECDVTCDEVLVMIGIVKRKVAFAVQRAMYFAVQYYTYIIWYETIFISG
jgi:hypothetical protein